MNVLYYECHINLKPELDREPLELIAQKENFRLAKFSMVNGQTADLFITGQGHDYYLLSKSATNIKNELISKGYKPYRLKIEAVILDKRF